MGRSVPEIHLICCWNVKQPTHKYILFAMSPSPPPPPTPPTLSPLLLCLLLFLVSTELWLPASLAQWLRRPPRERKIPGSNPACDGIFLGSRVIPVTLKLALQWLPCQAPGVLGSALGLVGPVSAYCDCIGCTKPR